MRMVFRLDFGYDPYEYTYTLADYELVSGGMAVRVVISSSGRSKPDEVISGDALEPWLDKMLGLKNVTLLSYSLLTPWWRDKIFEAGWLMEGENFTRGTFKRRPAPPPHDGRGHTRARFLEF